MDVNSRLISAVCFGELETTRELINTYGLSYSKSWANGYVLLNLALENGHTDVAELLLSKGSKVNSEKGSINRSDTPLHIAASQGNIKIVEMISNKIARIDAINRDGRTPLVEAIINRNIKATDLLLKYGANVNTIDCYGLSPLHLAIACKQQEIVMMLLTKGAAVNAKGNDGSTPLHNALEFFDKEIIITLLTKGADVNAKRKHGTTPLHLAAEKGYQEITTMLLEKKADVNAEKEDGVTPLHVAVVKGDQEITKILLAKGANINAKKNGLTPLHMALEHGRAEAVVELLLQHGAKVDIQDKDGKTILYLAVEKGYLTVVENVLKYCPDINNPSNRSSIYAAILGNSLKHGDIIDALLKYGFNVNPKDTISPELVHKAVEKGHLKVVEGFFKYGVDVDIRDSKYGFTPLQVAVTNLQKELVQLLLSYDADIYASDKEGKTALHFTALGSRMRSLDLNENQDTIINGEIAKLLLIKGANVDALAKNGDTTLHDASRSGCASVVEALLEYNASINAVNMFGLTPLHLAVEEGHQEIITMLLKRGADINAKQENGKTPLHLAAKYCPHDIIETILNFGADIYSRDKKSRTAFHFAFKNRDVKVVETLLEHGFEIDRVDCTSELAFKFDNSYFDRYRYFNLQKKFTAVRHYIVKMLAANLYVSKKTLNIVGEEIMHEMYDFYCKCKEEIANMKSEKINYTNISFYDILANTTSSLANYMRNENVVQVSKSDYDTKFPKYGRMIKCNFKKGMERKELLEQNNQIFHFFNNNHVELPRECTEKIFSYLSNYDMRILIDVFKPLSNSIPNVDNE